MVPNLAEVPLGARSDRPYVGCRVPQRAPFPLTLQYAHQSAVLNVYASKTRHDDRARKYSIYSYWLRSGLEAGGDV